MIECPNCGSTAQVRLEHHETYIWQKEIAVYLEYKCGCGQRFVTSIITNRENEKIT
ncbi:MAG: hypothetical protein IKB70_08345 [Bacilli bacterium]|nr:hypothetical protein [Bacilli bacterium]